MPIDTNRKSKPSPFNLTESPLKGFNLIDASAGTGKTFTICSLVLRLLLEKDLDIDQILVVTYTEAATEDLRNRIRQKLRLALDAVATGESEDGFLKEYLNYIQDKEEAGKRFSDALRTFDEASVFTIHSFCQRMLLEYSFESNSLFDTELVADDSFLIQEIIEDFWRRNFSPSSNLFSEYISDKLSPRVLLDFLSTFIPRPYLQFIPDLVPETECTKLSDVETGYIESYWAVCKEWGSARDEVRQHLLESGGLKRNTYRIKLIPDLLAAMDGMATGCSPSLRLFDKFSLFPRSRIISATKTNFTSQILPFYDLCENLTEIHAALLGQYDRCILALKKDLADSFRHEFDR
ncbi:MAG: UvrD-helicase domain-containing protein, partial [Deltaproteobacteria bacterium]|nr:UvrD-helicase domain-containing protein [Deltaproteobacteria bacterium]